MDDFKAEVLRLLAGRTHVFRQDKQRESIDGTGAAVLSNMDAKGLGPKNRFFLGRKICYPTSDYIDWVCSRIRPV